MPMMGGPDSFNNFQSTLSFPHCRALLAIVKLTDLQLRAWEEWGVATIPSTIPISGHSLAQDYKTSMLTSATSHDLLKQSR